MKRSFRCLIPVTLASNLLLTGACANRHGPAGHMQIASNGFEHSAPTKQLLSLQEAELSTCLRDTTFALRRPDTQNAGEPVLSFVQLADARISDSELEWRLSTPGPKDHDTNLELTRNDEFPMLALVGAINGLPVEKRPAFAIHVGNSVGSPTAGELARFLGVASQLDVPFFNVLGPRDTSIRGRFGIDEVGFDTPITRAAILNRRSFLSGHLLSYRSNPSSSGNVSVLPPTQSHGFDCTSPTCSQECNGVDCVRQVRSFYSVSIATQPPLRLVVLDTTGAEESQPTQLDGFIGPRQFDWVENELMQAALSGQRVLVFGHHPLSAQDPPEGSEARSARAPGLNAFPSGRRPIRLLDLLRKRPEVLAYLGGFSDAPRLVQHRATERGPYSLLEVRSPSIHWFPQIALWIDLTNVAGRLELGVRPVKGTFVSGSSVVAQRLAASCAGAAVMANAAGADCWNAGVMPSAPIAVAEIGRSDGGSHAAETVAPSIPSPMSLSALSRASSPEVWWNESKFYRRREIDVRRSGTATESERVDSLDVTRRYLSSDTKIHMFGVGWSNPLESYVDLHESTLCKITFWDAFGRRWHFEPAGVCERFMAQARMSASRITGREVLDVLIPQLGEGTTPLEYVGVGLSVAKLTLDKRKIEVTVGNESMRFSGSGRLTMIRRAGAEEVVVTRDTSGRAKVAANSKEWVSFGYMYEGSPLVDTVRYSDSVEYHYQYDPQSRLLHVHKGADRKEKVSYVYDVHGRLTHARVTGEPVAQIGYTDIGWRRQERNGERRREWQFRDDVSGHPGVDVTDFDHNELITRTEFQFDFATSVLKMADATDSARKTVRSYRLSQCGCSPLEIVEGEGKSSYEYDDLGRVRRIDTPTFHQELNYDMRAGKVASLKIREKADNGETNLVYQYSPRGDLVMASDGEHEARLGYEVDSARIAELLISNPSVPGSETRLRFRYNQIGKPNAIEVVGVGTILVSYNEAGEIQSVNDQSAGIDEAADMPGSAATISRNISASFQRLMDLVRPASVRIDTDYATALSGL